MLDDIKSLPFSRYKNKESMFDVRVSASRVISNFVLFTSDRSIFPC